MSDICIRDLEDYEEIYYKPTKSKTYIIPNNTFQPSPEIHKMVDKLQTRTNNSEFDDNIKITINDNTSKYEPVRYFRGRTNIPYTITNEEYEPIRKFHERTNIPEKYFGKSIKQYTIPSKNQYTKSYIDINPYSSLVTTCCPLFSTCSSVSLSYIRSLCRKQVVPYIEDIRREFRNIEVSGITELP